MQSAVPTSLRTLLPALLAVAALAGCQPTRPQQSDTTGIAMQAESLEAQGDYAGAAAVWEELAAASTGNARSEALLRGAGCSAGSGSRRPGGRASNTPC
jgi:hypothetical protein